MVKTVTFDGIVARIDGRELKTYPSDEGKEFGCEPDLSEILDVRPKDVPENLKLFCDVNENSKREAKLPLAPDGITVSTNRLELHIERDKKDWLAPSSVEEYMEKLRLMAVGEGLEPSEWDDDSQHVWIIITADVQGDYTVREAVEKYFRPLEERFNNWLRSVKDTNKD